MTTTDTGSASTILEQQVQEIETDWANNPRWKGVERRYSAEDVVRLRGSVVEEHTLARRGAERLWEAIETKPFTRALGAQWLAHAFYPQRVPDIHDAVRTFYHTVWQVTLTDSDIDHLLGQTASVPQHSGSMQ